MQFLVFGGTGNLGRVVTSKLVQAFPKEQIFVVSRRKHLDNSNIKYILFDEVTRCSFDSGLRILNLTNAFFRNPSSRQMRMMNEAILGSAKKITFLVHRTEAQVINFSSYLQNYDTSLISDTSYYVQLKKQSFDLLHSASKSTGNSFIDFVLYDNYGGHRKSKVFDLMIYSATTDTPLQVKFPLNRINLIACQDISESIIRFIGALDDFPETRYEIRSPVDYSLIELSGLVSRALNKPILNIYFGKQLSYTPLPYKFAPLNLIQNFSSIEEYILHMANLNRP